MIFRGMVLVRVEVSAEAVILLCGEVVKALSNSTVATADRDKARAILACFDPDGQAEKFGETMVGTKDWHFPRCVPSDEEDFSFSRLACSCSLAGNAWVLLW